MLLKKKKKSEAANMKNQNIWSAQLVGWTYLDI